MIIIISHNNNIYIYTHTVYIIDHSKTADPFWIMTCPSVFFLTVRNLETTTRYIGFGTYGS